ncbi:hypothetical protein F2Q69_00006285 [Brassica cretica]|uniref:Uncharacterized protein n=1 Tax=Brassica cretica TaxID=69181 RepID=A0A8S9P3A6_BRACR|nr:hypothetical protein F2Q69_00006285 [Brassica cretica]
MSSSEDKCEVSKDKHEDRRKTECFREAINSTEGKNGKSKPLLGGVYKDAETIDGAFKLIENMAASLANENQESDHSKKFNSVDTQKID